MFFNNYTQIKQLKHLSNPTTSQRNSHIQFMLVLAEKLDLSVLGTLEIRQFLWTLMYISNDAWPIPAQGSLSQQKSLATFQAKDGVGSKPKPKYSRLQKTMGPGSSDNIRKVFKHEQSETAQTINSREKITGR